MNSYILLLAFIVGYQLNAQTNPEKPQVSVQLVNATSIPATSVSINGEELYPKFPQGRKTGAPSMPWSQLKIRVKDLVSARVQETDLRLTPNTYQSVIFVGDLKESPNAAQLPLPSDVPLPVVEDKKKIRPGPNLQFILHSHELQPLESPLRYTFYNGMPAKSLRLNNPEGGFYEIIPGGRFVLAKQPSVFSYTGEVDGKTVEVLIRQEGLERSCAIVFYLTEKGPAFVRVFENTLEFEQKLAKEQKE
jgi:hypothetical protein